MKKQEIVIIIAFVVLIGTVLFFGLNLIKPGDKKEIKSDEIISKHWQKDDQYSEIVCKKNTDKNIYGDDVVFLKKIEYHIVYNNENVIVNEYYQYFLEYPTGLEYEANSSVVVEDGIGDVEYFDKQLTNIDTHYVIEPDIYGIDMENEKDSAEKKYQDYQEKMKNPYINEVRKLENEGYTCK